MSYLNYRYNNKYAEFLDKLGKYQYPRFYGTGKLKSIENYFKHV